MTDDDESREEGTSLFSWPLDSVGVRMGAGDLLDSLLTTITELNHTKAWPLTLLPPRPRDVIVDRERRQVSALCMWKRKEASNGR
ncbi:hypothetical protein [Bifidobacterium tibiigranuli]|jgi:hypothetical protein|nr:hypothetical protein [Bifidobacterium tibiigranuli]MCH4202796.1 hypothetical protein [Bifidobacterium tibiigranuli]MCH4274952.1 hypothetical protein [Bifidobacterium tibiigranuli]MCI1211038.1 hypothetical protein [Bifidobacterium tibiigranuli]MCI1221803.1 hypothetical protein [Bifidobacterium tibiigranuli]